MSLLHRGGLISFRGEETREGLLRRCCRPSCSLRVGGHCVHQRIRVPPGRRAGDFRGIGSGGGSVRDWHLGSAPVPEQALRPQRGLRKTGTLDTGGALGSKRRIPPSFTQKKWTATRGPCRLSRGTYFRPPANLLVRVQPPGSTEGAFGAISNGETPQTGGAELSE
jgi:hypothetical protein